MIQCNQVVKIKNATNKYNKRKIMKNIGMVVAVEINAVVEKYGTLTEVISITGYEIKKYVFENHNLFILHCGAGEIAAASATQLLISKFDVELIVNFGIVGGLTEGMKTLTTCVVEHVVHYDFDTSAADNIEIGRYMTYPSVLIPTTKKYVVKTMKEFPFVKNVICASGDKFIADKKEKQRLHEQFNADICEMEAAGIVLTCNRNKVPCLLIKTIADSILGGADEFRRQADISAKICLEITDKIISDLI